MTNPRSGALHFRSDIEGLRAVAILLVIGAHFAVPGLAGGFIGVDIFFVISGYLITGLLTREHQSTTRIVLSRFYANRLRRLLPALATMLIISSIVIYQVFPEPQHLGQSLAAAMAAFWVSNVYFTFSDVGYFAEEATNNAFLHTWSLGVEEQFYLLWPVLIVLALWLARRSSARTALTVLFATLAVASLAACLWIAQKQPTFAFYMMPTRAWQFAAGALVWLQTDNATPTKHAASIAGAIGLAILIAGLVTIDASTTYPSLLAVLPTAGTCMLLWAGTAKGSVPHAFLSLPPMQAIGRWSYALYLWHWPVLIIGEHLAPIRGNAANSTLAVAIAFAAAVLTHHVIENPIRYGRAKSLKPYWQIGLGLCAMVLVNSQLLRWHTQSTEALTKSAAFEIYSKAAADVPVIYQDGCDEWYHSSELKPCVYGNDQAEKTAVLLGDSIGAQWFPTLTHMLDAQQWKIIVLTKSSCPIVDEPFFYQRIKREYTECSTWRDEAIAWLATRKTDALFIGSTASSSFTDEQWTRGTRRILDKLGTSVGMTYLIEANPTLGFDGPDCLFQHQAAAPRKCTRRLPDDGQYVHVATLLKAVADEHPKTAWIDTSSLVCPDHECSAMQGDVIVFRDSQHLTASFTARAAAYFLQHMHQNEQARL